MQNFIKQKKQASIIENMLVMLLELIVVCAFLVVIFGAFAGISDKWGMRQVAREYSKFGSYQHVDCGCTKWQESDCLC